MNKKSLRGKDVSLLRIDLREVCELVLQDVGKILIKGDNSRLNLGFGHGDFVFIRYTIEDTELFEMTKHYATDKEVVIETQQTQEGLRQDLAEDGVFFDEGTDLKRW